MLTYADVCGRMLTIYCSLCGIESACLADVCCRMLSYADVCAVCVGLRRLSASPTDPLAYVGTEAFAYVGTEAFAYVSTEAFAYVGTEAFAYVGTEAHVYLCCCCYKSTNVLVSDTAQDY